MSSANDSSTTNPTATSDSERTSLQAVPPPPQTPPSPAKTKRTPLSLESLQRIVSRLDIATVVIVLLLTFLLASFAARNSDLWLHLAAGRAMVQEHSFLKEDPFSFTADGPWVNHSWLADLAVYGIFTATGGSDPDNPNLSLTGPVLIGIKAILMVILAWILMSIRRTGQSVWMAAVFTALTMVVLSRWMFLQPRCLSFLFLGLTLYLLQRPWPEVGERRFALSRPIVAIPLLFVLWVNLDEWFVLGPITVGLYLIGELSQQFLTPIRTGEEAPAPGQLGRLASLLVIGILACLINPNFYHAFRIPTDVWPWLTESPLQLDDTYVSFFQSPFNPDEISSAFSINPSSAEIAYYLLAALGLVSFLLNWAGWRGWRMMIWLAFFVMSARLMRTVPFFAVVAGPITALNLQDFAARRYGLDLRLENPWKTVSIGGRIATVIAGILLLVAAWPGMLHAHSDNALRTHHVSWQIEVNPSLHQAALRLRELRQAGVIGEGNGFNFSPGIADYCAWFCPEEKNFFDNRFSLFDKEVAETYVDMRAALSVRETAPQTPAEYQQLQQRMSDRAQQFIRNLRNYQINHLTVSGSSFKTSGPLIEGLLYDPEHWTPVYTDGRTAIIGWTPPRSPQANRFTSFIMKPERLAFAPDPPAEARSPSHGPTESDSRTFWDELWRGPTPRSLNTDLSAMMVLYSRTLTSEGRYYFMANQAVWQILSLGGTVGTAAGGNYLEQILLAMGLAGFTGNPPRNPPLPRILDVDPRSSPWAAALLAVRAARRAVVDNPQDAEAYLALADAVRNLWLFEGSQFGLRTIRQIQQAAALRKALALMPEQPRKMPEKLTKARLHERLAALYSPPEMRLIDLSSENRHKALEIIKDAGPEPKESQQDFQKRVDRKSAEVKAWDEQSLLERRKSEYQQTVRQTSTRYRRAIEARRFGLYQEALNLLIDNEEAIDLEANEARLALDLLVTTGRLEEARGQSQDIQDAEVRYEIAAGLGDYAQADEALAELIQNRQKVDVDRLLFLIRNATLARSLAPNGQMEYLMGLQFSASQVRNWSDLWAMRGVLALEAGEPVRAEQDFHKALELHHASLVYPFSSMIVQMLASRQSLEAAIFISAKYPGLANPFTFPEQAVAMRYLNMLQRAKETAQKPNPVVAERGASAP